MSSPLDGRTSPLSCRRLVPAGAYVPEKAVGKLARKEEDKEELKWRVNMDCQKKNFVQYRFGACILAGMQADEFDKR